MRRLGATLAVSVAMVGCASSPVAHDRDVVRRILPSTVQLQSERPGGGRRAASGVVIASDLAPARAWVITTRHFIEPDADQRVFARGADRRRRFEARIARVSADADLVLLEVPGLAAPSIALGRIAVLGDEVWVVGFPWGGRLTIVSGVVSQVAGDDGAAIEGPAQMVDASVSYGASGGGVYNAGNGELIGIVEGYRTARVSAPGARDAVVEVPVPGETTVVSATAIRRFLAESGYGRLLAP